MSYRTVVISNASYLQISKLQLQITQGDDIYTVPLEDIACIVLNHYQISLSANLLSGCATNNIVLISCDEKHLPDGIFHSYLSHSRQNLVLQKQINLSQAFKKRIWQAIVKQKIINQATVLEKTNSGGNDVSTKLLNLSYKISSGDKENREAQASRIYFPSLFGRDFIRLDKFKYSGDTIIQNINALLNYAYTIIRSLIIRCIVGYGLLPTLGIFHDNQMNAFNLADDFIEPFRAFIDWYVCTMVFENIEISLNKTNKAKLIDSINFIIVIDGKNTTVINAIDIMLKSFITCINTNNYEALLLPSLPSKLERSNIN
jgi:CRISPR-associated protein Cas1